MRAFLHRPTTASGRRALELALGGLGLTIVGAALAQRSPFALFGIVGFLGLLVILGAGVTGVVAVTRRHERSAFVYATLVPALLALFLVIGEFAFPHH